MSRLRYFLALTALAAVSTYIGIKVFLLALVLAYAAVEGVGYWLFDRFCVKPSDSRKAASAQIAEIPFPLASWVARQFKP